MSASTYATLYAGTGIALGDYVCRAPAGCTAHEESPGSDQIVFVRSGLFLVDVCGETLVGSANQVLHFRRGETYRVRHPVVGGDECTVIELGPETIEHAGRGVHALRGRRGSRSAAGAFLLQQRLVAALRNRRLPTRLAVDEALWSAVEGALEGAGACFDQPSSSGAARRHRHCVETVIALVGSRLGENLSLGTISREVGVSPFHLSRIFRRHTGWPIHRYQRSLRLRAAVTRLAGGERDLTRLALDLGFSDHSHFTSAFRQEFGVAPSGFRQMALEGVPPPLAT